MSEIEGKRKRMSERERERVSEGREKKWEIRDKNSKRKMEGRDFLVKICYFDIFIINIWYCTTFNACK